MGETNVLKKKKHFNILKVTLNPWTTITSYFTVSQTNAFLLELGD
jgi:hypothetical protein